MSVNIRTKVKRENYSYNLFPDPQGNTRTITNNANNFESINVTPIRDSHSANGLNKAIVYDVEIISSGAALTTSFHIAHRSIEVPNLAHADNPGVNPIIDIVDFFSNIGTLLDIDVIPRHTFHGITTYDIFTLSSNAAGTNYTLLVTEAEKAQTSSESDTDISDTDVLASKTLERNRDGNIVYNSFMIIAGT